MPDNMMPNWKWPILSKDFYISGMTETKINTYNKRDLKTELLKYDEKTDKKAIQGEELC